MGTYSFFDPQPTYPKCMAPRALFVKPPGLKVFFVPSLVRMTLHGDQLVGLPRANRPNFTAHSLRTGQGKSQLFSGRRVALGGQGKFPFRRNRWMKSSFFRICKHPKFTLAFDITCTIGITFLGYGEGKMQRANSEYEESPAITNKTVGDRKRMS